jgi:hypothetical protein
VFDVVAWEDVSSTEHVWEIVVNFLTKRTKDITPEREYIDKRNCRVCFGDHHMTAGVHLSVEGAKSEEGADPEYRRY